MAVHENSDRLKYSSYEFVNGSPSEDYVCAICTLVARDPHQVNCCGGLFCKDCLQRLGDSTEEPLCPRCRKDLLKRHFKDSRAERHIKNLQIYCTNKAKGCVWDGKMSEVERHLEICECESVKCCDCGEELLRKHLDGHLADQCPKRRFTCPKCKLEGVYSFIKSADHIDECPDTVIPCPNDGCNKEMYRKLLKSHASVCPKETISCSFAIAGCCVMTTREDVIEHERQFIQEHLQLSLEHMQQQDVLIRQQDARIQQQDERIQQQDIDMQQQDTKTQVLDIKIQRQDTEIRQLNARIQQQDNEILAMAGQRNSQMTFCIKDFHATASKKQHHWCPPFYTSISNGYKMNISINFTENHMSFFTFFIPGQYDDTLEWPFRGEVTVELLNQLEDKNHLTTTFTFDSSTPRKACDRPGTGSTTSGWGQPDLIRLSDLSSIYSQNDTVFIRATVKVLSKTKSWLATTIQ